jgi:NitT/TauT family transport system substrate-binding protein
MQVIHSRRHFLASASLAMAAGALGVRGSLAAEGPPETATIRLGRFVGICAAPVYTAEALLRAEGFTDVRYVPKPPLDVVARGEADFDIEAAPWVVAQLAAGEPTTALAGIHPGCFELFAYEPIRTISDLRGKRFGIPAFGSSPHLLLAVMAAHVGLDPKKDIDWIVSPTGYSLEMFANREVDAFLGFPPDPQELRARGLGRAILNMATDQPWSQYFCCTVFGNRTFVEAHPIATKRFLRAVLKTADLCTSEPQRVAQRLVDAGFTKRYEYALQSLTELPYASWREFDPEDTVRFFALRLHEGRHYQVDPADDHRRRHRLALPERAQARAEGVSGIAGRILPPGYWVTYGAAVT